jgi:hypothetical protein
MIYVLCIQPDLRYKGFGSSCKLGLESSSFDNDLTI